MRRISAMLALLVLTAPAQAGVLRVCADDNNLPFSNKAGEGFENRIAALIARDLKDTVQYAYALQNARFLKHTLFAHRCDVVPGVTAGMEGIETTRPYYASTYVFVARRKDALDLSSLRDPRLRRLIIGVHLIGDDSTPPVAALGREGIVDNVRGYMIQGDFSKPNPPARLIEAVRDKEVDVAAVWGPLGGYFARRSGSLLEMRAITGTEAFAPLRFRFAIAMGVRPGDDALRDKLDAALLREKGAIRIILTAYGVPLVEIDGVRNG
ncbi:MAG: quinoprotein dehydrogenase-associated putative ABC transporter substrate-binding protein [Alphaproteobacteria bacterium]|nr:quinoprotein dehydrogenase-associated putative ABC transporter substrate-binding protein [Alphaproteobacteria bacterium]MBV9692618.1 quinoprotein dehydrogenase-associated putative ABC transporter substrate-binding protein [Alphaproteobacteria bacterium]